MARIARQIAASPEAVWKVMGDPATWPEWGPVMADLEDIKAPLRRGMRGSVLMVPGLWLPCEITEVGTRGDRHWSWRIGHLPPFRHGVIAVGHTRGESEAYFTAPLWYPGHLLISRLALHHLDAIVMSRESA